MNYSPWAQEPCIMFADANADLRAWVKTFLEREGFKVLTVRSSLEALTLAADYPFAIDVLITDARTRIHQNGAELAECFRILRPETRLLLLADAGDRAELEPGRFSEEEFLTREFKRSQLVSAVARITHQAASKAA